MCTSLIIVFNLIENYIKININLILTDITAKAIISAIDAGYIIEPSAQGR